MDLLPLSLVQMGYRLCSAREGSAGMQEKVRPTCPQRQRREGLESRSISGQAQQMGRGALRQKARGLSWGWGLRGQVDRIISWEELLCTAARLCGRWDALGSSILPQVQEKTSQNICVTVSWLIWNSVLARHKSSQAVSFCSQGR